MKQKGLCRALLLILFATCAVAGRAQEVLRSDSVTGVDAGKESLKIQPSASEVTPEKVGARLALTDTLVADTAQWAFRPSLPPLYRNGTVAYSRQVIMVDIGAYGNCMKVLMPVWT